MAIRTINFYGAYSTFRPFIITVDSGADSQFTIPTTGAGYNYSVNTSDGQTFNGVTGNLTITFPSANTLYDVSISGIFSRIYFNNGTQRLKLIDIKQWGDIEWTSMLRAFQSCSNTTCSATDVPNVSSVTNMASMFYGASAFNSDLSNWDVSSVTDMASMFYGASAFNSDLSNWDVSSVTAMASMFYGASAFNSDLSSWNVSNVTNMSYMFYGASAFNSDLSSWNVSNVTNMSYMFGGASAFNSDLSNWNVSKVTSLFAFLRFANSYSFDIDFSNAVTGSVLNTNIASFYRGGSSISIKMQCGNVVTTDLYEFDGALVSEMEAIGMSKSLYIARTALTGIGIDNLANSVKDMTGLASPTVTMTVAQKASCDISLWANKNWTIATV